MFGKMKLQELNIRSNRIIFHIDVNSAFLSWEAVYRLTHKGGRTDLREMASDFQKPDRVHTLYPEEIREKMWPLPVSDLFFVGRATSGKLLSMGIRYADFSYVSHQRGFYNPTSITIEIHKTACRLFREAWNGMPVRHLSIHTTRIDGEESWRQGDFSDPADYGKLFRLDGAVDRIRDCFGIDSVKRAVFLNQPIDHMSGGISREKRSVDDSLREEGRSWHLELASIPGSLLEAVSGEYKKRLRVSAGLPARGKSCL